MNTTTSPNVDGWASKLYGSIDAPAVVVSPSADPVALMCWAFGQIQQLNVLLLTISTSRASAPAVEPSELASSIRHQLQQIECVIEAAIERLPSDHRGAEA